MNKQKFACLFLVINSVSLLASDKETPADTTIQQQIIQTLTTNKRSYTDLAAQVVLGQPVKYTRSSEQTEKIDSRTQAEKNEWDQRTALQKCLMTPNEHDQRANQPDESFLYDSDSDFKPASPAYLLPYSSSDDEDSNTRARRNNDTVRFIGEQKNSSAAQQEQWCPHHDRAESCHACAAPTYFFGSRVGSRDGNDSE